MFWILTVYRASIVLASETSEAVMTGLSNSLPRAACGGAQEPLRKMLKLTPNVTKRSVA